MVYLYGKFVGKYTSAMDAMGYIQESTTAYHLLKENLHLDVPGS